VAVRFAGLNPTRARPTLERSFDVLAVTGTVQDDFFSKSRKIDVPVAVSTSKNRYETRRRKTREIRSVPDSSLRWWRAMVLP
jgi:hypothetical protein